MPNPILQAMKTGFNPRSPRGGATPTTVKGVINNAFQSTLPTRGSDF